ncbi:MAG TPA: hypothetical protein H9870_02650 [Candidatus Corynebacterium avicola]|uniref:Uncharacterized protein n=1 Tax=Candidatus Corynebacterium avicola TaxID=2838527 RepID=A0A9D1RNY3_9CORY|nr:hypothetical protein [Candidatus Corynebacterium avicola]
MSESITHDTTSGTPHSESTSVAIPGHFAPIFTVGGALIGLAAAFVVGPLVAWLLGIIGDAPGPLRLAAELPLVWAVPVLTIIGAVAGFLICASWTEDAGTIEVSDAGITRHLKDSDRFFARERITGVVASGKELVLLGDAAEIYRGASESEMIPGLRAALRAHGYPELLDTDPHEREFSAWVEGNGALSAEAEDQLRIRRRALTDKKVGEAEGAAEKLRTLGVMVRDRDGRQQVRVLDHLRP